MENEASHSILVSLFSYKAYKKKEKAQAKHPVEAIVGILYQVEGDTRRKNEKQRRRMLENSCAELYTKPCFTDRIVNAALRDDD